MYVTGKVENRAFILLPGNVWNAQSVDGQYRNIITCVGTYKYVSGVLDNDRRGRGGQSMKYYHEVILWFKCIGITV